MAALQHRETLSPVLQSARTSGSQATEWNRFNHISLQIGLLTLYVQGPLWRKMACKFSFRVYVLDHKQKYIEFKSKVILKAQSRFHLH